MSGTKSLVKERRRVIVRFAGDSGDGREFAARTADVVFSAHATYDDGRAFYDDVKGRLAAYGRDRDSLKILPAVTVTSTVRFL